MKIAIIGKGNVGTAMGAGLKKAGHEVRYGHRDPNESIGTAAKWGEVLLLAVPYPAIPETVKEIGKAADGKTLIDITNALTSDFNLAVGFSTSAAENLQRMLPNAHVVKAFNTVFAQNQSTGKVGNHQLTAFIASDHAGAKQKAVQLARDIGFEPLDVGGLKSARYLEPMAVMIISLGYGMNMGTNIGYKMVKG